MIKTIVFNAKPNLFAFNNKIYDLACDAIIEPNPYDYISITCGYNYNEYYDSNKIIEYSALLDTIFPNKANKEYYLECLATGLTGYQVENLFIATGQGGNGKGVINTQMMKTAGNYGYKLSSSVLLNEIKEGANPQIANLHQKRFALSTEPSDKKTMCSSTLKELTGGLFVAQTVAANKPPTIMPPIVASNFSGGGISRRRHRRTKYRRLRYKKSIGRRGRSRRH